MSIFGVFVILMYLIFILIDYDDFAGKWQKMIPFQYRSRTIAVVQDVEDAMNKYFRAQALIALIIGVLFAIGFSIIGLPMAIAFGLMVGAMNMVPYLQLAAIPPALFLALLQSLEYNQSLWMTVGLMLVVFAVVQLIQDLFIVPKIMEEATGLNPAGMILALSIWGSLLGILGMIIALPVSTLLLSYYKRFIAKTEDEDDDEKNPSPVQNTVSSETIITENLNPET
jgi:predicted PurR-regulated permease PerM